jgi:hypothetical protein
MYTLVASNVHGAATSTATFVEVVPLFLTASPQDQSTFQGGNARFDVAATGQGPMNHQWQFNGTDISGATGGVFQLAKVRVSDAGEYRVRVGNTYGSVTSSAARLQVSEVVAWGGNAWGRTNVPPGLRDVRLISPGSGSVLALKNDGTLVGWEEGPAVPAGLDHLVDAAPGLTHQLALRHDGIVVAWGDNSLGQTDVPPGLSNVVAVGIASGVVNFALTANGEVAVWGDLYQEIASVPAGLTRVVSLSFGSRHVLALLSDGTVAAWGNNELGQIEVPFGLANVVKVLAVGDASLALCSDGTVVAWGDNANGQTQVPLELTGVVALASSGLHNLALTRTGRVVAWGANDYGQSDVPVELEDVVAVSAGTCTSLALTRQGKIVAWGIAMPGQSAVLPLLENVQAVMVVGDYAIALLGEQPPATGLSINGGGWTANGFTLDFTAPRSIVYSIERTDSLSPPVWIGTPLYPGTGATNWTDDQITPAQRFYRVRKW